jgi:hypothetical protein
VSSINSFTYLQRQYPLIYGTSLLPNYNATTNTADADAQDFGFDGWQVGMNPARRGYYDPMRPHNADYTDSFLQTKKDWINDRSTPGSKAQPTTIASQRFRTWRRKSRMEKTSKSS